MATDKQKLLEELRVLADKYTDLKKTILSMVDELDRIEKEYTETVNKIKIS